MSQATIQQALLWCAIINYCLLILWFVIMVLPHQWLYKLSGKPFHVTEEQFDSYNLMGIIIYKLAVVLFNLVPYIALRIVAG